MTIDFGAPPSLEDARRRIERAVQEDRTLGSFRVHRSTFTEPWVLELERRAIFDRCWLYLGHVSELPAPTSFVTRNVGGRSLLFNRDRDGTLRAFYNTCSHRGAQVAREPRGQRKLFTCPYHAWSFSDTGKLVAVPGGESMAAGLVASGNLDLTPVPRLAEHCGFVFVCFDPDAVPLVDYLADAGDVLKLISEHGPRGMEVVDGIQEYCVPANWKLLQENSADGYHAASTHASYFDYVNARDGAPKPIDAAKAAGRARALGNGHAVLESSGAMPWGRPYARWVPGWGEDARVEVEGIARELTGRLGEARGNEIALGDRNMLIFPNLVVNDIMAITVRTFYPVRPDYIEVNAWALAPVGESEASRDRRLRNFLEFLGPAGFATPDDVDMLESCQKGYANRAGAQWNDLSRGMHKDVPAKQDEHQMREFWRRWHQLLQGALR